MVKFTPDVDKFEFDYDKSELIRENCKQIINPDDACAMGFALDLKKRYPDIQIEAVLMAPLSVLPQAEDIARRGIDFVTVLSDKAFAGSDTLATRRVLGTYVSRQDYDVILTGSRSLDGDTAQVPAELAAYLRLDCMTGITKIEETSFLNGRPVVTVETENETYLYEIPLPAVLGLSSSSGYRLPFVRFADLDLDVNGRVRIIGSDGIGFPVEMAGNAGSATKVLRTFTAKYEQKKERILVRNDEEGVETVYRFLKEKGYLK